MPGPVNTSTTFSLDVVGRYVCNTLDEARASTDRGAHPDARPFDFIVIGGGSFGAVFATHVFDRDDAHQHRVLVLEAGPLALPEHVQNLPSDLNPPGKGGVDTVWGQPWLSDKDFPGLAFCLGGRSVFWGGWSPYLIASELADPSWPASVKTDLTQSVLPPQAPVESYLDEAARQIGSDTDNDFVFGPLHEALRKRLFDGLQARAAGPTVLTGQRGTLGTADDLEAPLAVQSAPSRPGSFPLNKFNGVQLLIRAARVAEAEATAAVPYGDLVGADTKKRLMVVNNVYVTRLVRDASRILRVETNKGAIDVPPQGTVVLALGTIENTRMALNTVPEKALIGRNLMAHLRSNVTLRVPHSSFAALGLTKELAVSALFVKGIHTRSNGALGHFHVQITATGTGQLGMNSEAELFKKIPNIDELDAFRDLDDRWIVVTLRGIGEMIGDKTSAAPENRIQQGPPDGNGVARAQVQLVDPQDSTDPRGKLDNELWNAMDAACDELAAMFAGSGPIQFLSTPNDTGNAVWQGAPPTTAARRDAISSTHHESGTLWMGDQPQSSVTDPFGRIWELDNLYVAGPALLPTMGSPNPMLSGVALSRRTANELVPLPEVPVLEPGFQHLFDGTERTFQRWNAAGPGSFALVDGALVAQPGPIAVVDGVPAQVGSHSVFYYAADQFDDFVLRLQVQLRGPNIGSGRPVDNSGVFVRFHRPHRSGAELPTNANPALKENVTVDPAWVAAYTGFEIQIDENGGPDFADKHRTGAIYNVPTGPGGLASFQAGPALQPGQWADMEITVKNHRYTVKIDGQQTADFQNPRSAAVTDAPGLPLSQRGLGVSEDPLSGYVGVQAHTGNVAFRNIRLRKL